MLKIYVNNANFGTLRQQTENGGETPCATFETT